MMVVEGVDEDGAQCEGGCRVEAAGGEVERQVEESDETQKRKRTSGDEQLHGAGDREKQDKIQDGERLQEHRGYDERAKADAVGMEWRGRAVRG